MPVSAITGNSLFAGFASTAVQNKFQQIQHEFQQLGQDLQSGNLSQAQSDFAALQPYLPGQQQSVASATQADSQNTNPVLQTISKLGQDLKAGNLSAAQSDFTTLQQDLQQQGAVSGHRHHHRPQPGSPQESGQQNGVATLFGNLSQELQSGNLTAAQQTYSALQQDFLQFTSGNGSASSSGSSSSTPGSTGLSVSA